MTAGETDCVEPVSERRGAFWVGSEPDNSREKWFDFLPSVFNAEKRDTSLSVELKYRYTL